MADRLINTSGKDRWGTPPEVVRWVLENIGPITLDAAADDETALVEHYIGPGGLVEDALENEWPETDGVAFCNPPYSKRAGGLEAWCRAMYENSRRMVVVGLFFSRTETKAWHNFVALADRVYFVKKRLKFIDPDTGKVAGWAPAPSVIVVWRPRYAGPPSYRNLCLDDHR